MPPVTTETRGQAQVFKLSGAIDDVFDFSPVTAATANEVVIDFDGVSAINSFGVKKWSLAMQELKGRKLRYANCRPVAVNQMNIVLALATGIYIESLYLPYECNGCVRESMIKVTGDEARAADFTEDLDAKFTCERCARTLEFIEDPDMYFHFLTRSAKA